MPDRFFISSILVAALCGSVAAESFPVPQKKRTIATAALYSARQVTAERLKTAKAQNFRGIVLELKGGSAKRIRSEQAAARRILAAGFELSYWIEIARNPVMAKAHPEWMGSIQGHQQWRRLFKQAPRPAKGEVIKVYPWVPILYKEAFDAHLARVDALLRKMPSAVNVYLNDLQGAPSACGCGNALCRWTTDYGPIKTATPLGDDAAARFVTAVGRLVPKSRIIPVWVTECEKPDGARDGWCAGVGCYNGICWKAWMRQLTPVAKVSDKLAVLATYRELNRDLPIYRDKASWVRFAIEFFQTMPRRHGAKPIAARRLVAVVQGWNVENKLIQQQRDHARDAGVAAIVVAFTAIDQSWEPRLHKP